MGNSSSNEQISNKEIIESKSPLNDDFSIISSEEYSVLSSPPSPSQKSFININDKNADFLNDPILNSGNNGIKKNQYTYKLNHLKSKIDKLQLKEKIDIPIYVFKTVIDDLVKKEIDLKNVKPTHIRKILKRHRMSNYYEYLQQIYCHITNSLPVELQEETEDKIIQMFIKVCISFEKYKSHKGANFLNYSYILNKLFKIIGLEINSTYFPVLQRKEKLKEYDEIWKNICEDNNWEFHTSI